MIRRWFGLVVTVVTLGVVAGVIGGAETVPPMPSERECFTEEVREEVRTIMIDAVNHALHDQIKSLFAVWMRDERGQPDRASVGIAQALSAYKHAREQAEEWSPPVCKGGGVK